MNPVELQMQRRQTRAFIEADPISVRLNRPSKSRKDSGERSRENPTTLPSQSFHLTSQGGGGVQSLGGQAQENQALLVGYHDADVQRDDWFVLDGQRYDVIYVHPNREYRTEATLARKGRP